MGMNGNGKGGVMEASCHKRGVDNGGRSFRLEMTPHPPQCAAEQCSALQGTLSSRGRRRGGRFLNRVYAGWENAGG